MLKNNKVLFVLSLLISVALWVYVMGTVDPQIEAHINNIPVKVTGQEPLKNNGISAKLDSPYEVSIVISGKRSEVNKVEKKEFIATVDVSTCEMGKNTAPVEIKIPTGARGIVVESISEPLATFTVK